jgi:POT family proton-dependent oligopeptide transporter
MSTSQMETRSQTLFGHPTGLFTLFFAEMWERFSYYGMRALLIFYMIKGFLGYGDSDAYAVYGAYTALVYMTPFFGGMLADQLLGARRAVILGGVLMAAGHLMMTVENSGAFFTALALLICGNGFFKPNISTIVGSLYPEGSPKRDGGFTIFYMGVNLGAAMSPLLCGYIGETYGWHYGFGLATIGMLTGIAVFVAPSLVSQVLMFLMAIAAAMNIFIVPGMFSDGSSLPGYMNMGLLALLALVGLGALTQVGRAKLEDSFESTFIARIVIMSGAISAAVTLFMFCPDNPFSVGVNVFVGVSLLIAGVIAWVALGRGGLPKEAGAAPDARRLSKPVLGPVSAEWMVYLGTAVAIAIFVLLVSGFAPLTPDNRAVTIIPDSVIERMEGQGAVMEVLAVVLRESSRPAGLVLILSGLIGFAYLAIETFRLDKVPRERMFVVLILIFFSMLFWSFFEQAGSSVNNFTDRNVDRVFEQRTVAAADVGQTIRIQPTQEQLGYHNGEKLFTIDVLDGLREKNSEDPNFEIDWTVADDNVGMGLANRVQEIPASTFQSVNPIYIVIFGLVFTALWGMLANRGLEPSTPFKFALGLLQLGLGFGAFWYGAQVADGRGMVALEWLFLGYLFQTTGELCLSPVGLSMVTKLSPARLVSTVMGAWFLATAFSQFLAAIIAQFTGVTEGGNGGNSAIPIPRDTVNIYGDVFGKIAISAMVSALICFAMTPLLSRWMHAEAVSNTKEL